MAKLRRATLCARSSVEIKEKETSGSFFIIPMDQINNTSSQKLLITVEHCIRYFCTSEKLGKLHLM